MNNKKPTDNVISLPKSSAKADQRLDARREAKASNIKQRFSSSRKDAESKTKAAERLKKLFVRPDSDSGKPS